MSPLQAKYQRDGYAICAGLVDGRREGGIAAEVPAGSVVFFNGFTLHRSLDNRRTSGYRRVLVNHCMSAQARLPWRFGASHLRPETRKT